METDDTPRVLLLEDVATDAELVERALRKDGLVFTSRCVSTRDGFIQALSEFRPDILLSDFRLPDMDGFGALTIVREHAPDLPVIIVTGALGDEAAARLLKEGATDYVLKDRLSRLPLAFRRALSEVAETRARRLIEEALRERQSILDGFFESPGVMRGVLEVVDGDFLNVMVNAAGAQFFGRNPDAVRGQRASVMGMPATIIRLWLNHCQQSLRDGHPVRFEYVYLKPERETRWLATIVSPVAPMPGAKPRFAYSTQDVTDIKAREAELRRVNTDLGQTLERLKASQRQVVQAEKMSAIGTMAAGMAHELNNPLMGVINYVEYARTLATTSEMAELLAKADRELDRISHLIRTMLAFALPAEEPVAPVSVAELVARSLDITSGEWKAAGIAIETHVPEDLPKIAVKPAGLQQALVNVLLNARDAVRKSPRKDIKIVACRQNHAIRIDISDGGPGIPEELRERIFDPFFTTKAPGEGTGLGLSVARSLITDMGGSIACTGRQGHGATFTLVLPAAG